MKSARIGRGKTVVLSVPTVFAGDKEHGPIWSARVGWRKRTGQIESDRFDQRKRTGPLFYQFANDIIKASLMLTTFTDCQIGPCSLSPAKLVGPAQPRPHGSAGLFYHAHFVFAKMASEGAVQSAMIFLVTSWCVYA